MSMFDQGDISGFMQNMSVILQPEATTDKFGDITQMPNDLIQELNQLEDNSQLSHGIVNRIFDRDMRQDFPDANEQQQSSLMIFDDEE